MRTENKRNIRKLLNRPIMKVFRDNLFQFKDYIHTIGSPGEAVISISIFLHSFELLCTAFFFLKPSFWKYSSAIGPIVTLCNYISLLFPMSTVVLICHIIILVYAFLVLLVILIFFVFQYNFTKYARVSDIVCRFYVIILDLFVPHMHYTNSGMLAYILYHLYYGDCLALSIICFIIILFNLDILLFEQCYQTTPAVPFRPISLPLCSLTHCRDFQMLQTINMTISVLSCLIDGKIGIILSYTTLLPRIGLFLITLSTYLWSDAKLCKNMQTLTLSSCFLSIIIPSLQLLGVVGSESVVFICIVMIIATYLVISHMWKIKSRRLNKLFIDIEADGTIFNSLNRSTVLNLLYEGYSQGNRLCHNYSIFEKAFEKFPKDKDLVRMYARFSAIYVSDRTQLSNAIGKVLDIKQHSLELKYVLYQLRTLARKRDQSTTKDITKSLQKAEEKAEKSKTLIRYIWEKILRGQVESMKEMSIALEESENDTIKDFKHMCILSANNAKVFYAYAKYLSEVACRFSEAKEAMAIYHTIKTGMRTRGERTYYFASKMIPNLPTEEDHMEMNRVRHNHNESFNAEFTISRSTSDERSDGFFIRMNAEESNEDSQAIHLESLIDSVRVPNTITTILSLIICNFVIYACASSFFLVEYVSMNSSFEKERALVEYYSKLRVELSQMIFLTHQYAMSSAGFLYNLSYRWNYVGGSSLPSGFSSDGAALKSSIKAVGTLAEDLSLAAADIPSSNVKGYFEYLIDSSIQIKQYSNLSYYYLVNYSIQSLITQSISISLGALSMNTTELLNWPSFWTLIDNAETISKAIGSSISLLSKSFKSVSSSFQNQWNTWMIIVFSITIAISLAISITALVRRSKVTKSLFKAFKSIPGSAIASTIQKFAAVTDKDRKDKKVIHRPKAEENALYILKSHAESTEAQKRRTPLLWPTIFAVVFDILLMFNFAYAPTIETGNIQPIIAQYFTAEEPHICVNFFLLRNNRIESTNSSALNSIFSENATKLCEENQEASETVGEILQDLWLGSSDGSYGSASSAAVTYNTELSQITNNESIITASEMRILSNISYENSVSYLSENFMGLSTELLSGSVTTSDFESSQSAAIVWLFSDSYSDVLSPALDSITSYITEQSENMRVEMLAVSLVSLSILFIIAVIVVALLIADNHHILWSFRLLLFCEPDVVLRSRNIIRILSNEYGNQKDKEDLNGTSTGSIHEKVVSHMTDAVIFMTSDFIIRSVNAAVENIMGIEQKNASGKNLLDIIVPEPGKELSFRAFKQAIEASRKGLRPPNISMEVEVLRNGKPSTLKFSLVSISLTREVLVKPTNIEAVAIICCTVADMTSTIASRTLLNNEHERGAHLLSMILPPIIVKKLQKGEKNISFSVPSASVIFIDIVSFTPWCGSLPASTVMATLNQLFGMYDKLLLKYDKMTKIKCIGDCYMAAGGLFEEVNQPSVHAKQAVSFCLDVISGLEEFNREHNTQLRVRAGCNTGGPIVAGVLGIDKPTFDILGPSISMAEAMEHFGIPMLVHIPQHVYDLIYDDQFKIKERGDITVKGGNQVKTFLVSGRGNM